MYVTDSLYFSIAGKNLAETAPDSQKFLELQRKWMAGKSDKRTPGLLKLELSCQGILAASPKLYLAFDYESEEEFRDLAENFFRLGIIKNIDSSICMEAEPKTKRASKGVRDHIKITPIMLLNSIFQLTRYYDRQVGLRKDPKRMRMVECQEIAKEIVSSVNIKGKMKNYFEMLPFH